MVPALFHSEGTDLDVLVTVIDGFRKQDADVKRTSNDREKLGRGRRRVYIKIVFRH